MTMTACADTSAPAEAEAISLYEAIGGRPALGDSFDSPTRQAWELAYNLMAETMLEGAASARPIGTQSHARAACRSGLADIGAA